MARSGIETNRDWLRAVLGGALILTLAVQSGRSETVQVDGRDFEIPTGFTLQKIAPTELRPDPSSAILIDTEISLSPTPAVQTTMCRLSCRNDRIEFYGCAIPTAMVISTSKLCLPIR